MSHVLLIEDDPRIRQVVERGLGSCGFSVSSAPATARGIDVLRNSAVDIVLLDLVLPDLDGLALLRAIRATRPQLPVIALTALDDMRSKLEGFDGGADDYVTKPFSIAELAARIRARLRSFQHGGTRLEVGALTLDLATHRASLKGRSVLLSAREASLLAAFTAHPRRVLSRGELLRLVWEIDFDPGTNIVDVYVAALRRKLGPDVIETVRGRGYRLRTRATPAPEAVAR
jgi:two-component system, OmpR family, response regulator